MDPSPKSALQISTLPQGEGGRANASIAPAAIAETTSTPTVRIGTLEELAALAQAKGSPVLRVQIENNVRLIRLEPGHLEFAPTPVAPRTLAGDLAQKLKEWTGVRWSVIVAREGGMPTIAEQKKSAKEAKLESVLQEPFVRAVLDRFPGAEVIAVRDLVEDDVTQPMPEKDTE
jgi:DNA polymerase-3 subunit gamma/tau